MRNTGLLSGTPKEQQQQRRGSLLAPSSSNASGQSPHASHLLPDLVAATNNLELIQQLRSSSFEQQNGTGTGTGTTASGHSNKSSGSSGSGRNSLNNSNSNGNGNGNAGSNGHLGVYSPIQRSQTENLNLSQPHADASNAHAHAAEQLLLDKSGASQAAAGANAGAGARLGSRSTQAIVQQEVLHGRSPPSRERRTGAPQIQVEVDLDASPNAAVCDERRDSFSPSNSISEQSPPPGVGIGFGVGAGDEQVLLQSVDLEGAPDAFAPSNSNLGGGAGGGAQVSDAGALGGGVSRVVPEIRKYKKRFNGEVLCASLWGVNLLIGTESGLMFLDRSGQGVVLNTSYYIAGSFLVLT